MFVYNITSKVDHHDVDNWLHWQKKVHIPAIMQTECFYAHRFYELLGHDDQEGRTFVIQFLAHSKSDYNRYLENHVARLRRSAEEKWKDAVVSFRTLLVEVP